MGRLAALALSAAAVVAITVPVARAQEPAPEQQVLAVVSPLANPVCAAAGTSTLLVPVVGGLVSEQLALGDQVDIADLVLDALGPVFVTCGTLPASDGTRCELVDNQIVALWPTQLADTGLTAPPLGGNLIEALTRAGDVLGIPLSGLLEPPLQCSIPTSAESPAPPPPVLAPASPSEVPSDPVALPPVGVSGTGPSVASVGAAPTIEVAATPAPAATSPGTPLTTIEVLARHASGLVRLLQLLVALALAGFLTSSWYRSWAEARTPGGHEDVPFAR